MAKEDSGPSRSCGFQLFSAWKCWVPWVFFGVDDLNDWNCEWWSSMIHIEVEDAHRHEKVCTSIRLPDLIQLMVSLSTRRWVHLRHDIFFEQRAISNSYRVRNIMCWNMFAFYSVHVFWYLMIFVFFFLHMFFIYLFIYGFFCNTGWKPFFSSSLHYEGL